VRFVVSVQPFSNEALQLVDVASPARTAPLSIYVYELADRLADPAVWSGPDDLDGQGQGRSLADATARYLEQRADSVRVTVLAPRAAFLILRRTQAPGWSATVNGRPAALTTANGRHQAVAVPAGASDVVLSYRAPRGGIGAGISLASLGVAIAAWLVGRRRAAVPLASASQPPDEREPAAP